MNCQACWNKDSWFLVSGGILPLLRTGNLPWRLQTVCCYSCKWVRFPTDVLKQLCCKEVNFTGAKPEKHLKHLVQHPFCWWSEGSHRQVESIIVFPIEVRWEGNPSFQAPESVVPASVSGRRLLLMWTVVYLMIPRLDLELSAMNLSYSFPWTWTTSGDDISSITVKLTYRESLTMSINKSSVFLRVVYPRNIAEESWLIDTSECKAL